MLSWGWHTHSLLDARYPDPPLLHKHSTTEEFKTGRFIYPAVRVFFKRHQQESQLPVKPAPLPLLVFIHGLGGSVEQFHPLLTRLTDCASCVAIDLPGCGRSAFAPEDWDAYSSTSLVELLEAVVARYRGSNQGLVLIGHSMGCSLAALLASRLMPCEHSGAARSASPVLGLVAICPTAEVHGVTKIAIYRALLCIPSLIFDAWRTWESRGGPNGLSVTRFVGDGADDEAKSLQFTFNKQSKTAVWRRMAWGCLPVFISGKMAGGLPGRDVWSTLHLPVCLITGESDHITPPAEAKKLVSFLSLDVQDDSNEAEYQSLADNIPRPTDALNGDDARHSGHTPSRATALFSSPSSPRSDTSQYAGIPPLHLSPPRYVESHVVPPPAAHGLLYVPSTVGIVSALVSNFLARHVTGRLDRGWQIRFLSREGKWDVKNLEKWSKVQPVSSPIGNIFRAMKTLRQVDKDHSPRRFVENWALVVKDIIDISHDSPVYDPRDLETGGIRYHKFPTVSKIPPSPSEVEAFNALVDKIRTKRKQDIDCAISTKASLIGVHCHYGFNRTGYFIVCYLVDRCNYTVDEAITTFAKARPVGIRHAHFLDSLSLKYAKVSNDGTSF